MELIGGIGVVVPSTTELGVELGSLRGNNSDLDRNNIRALEGRSWGEAAEIARVELVTK